MNYDHYVALDYSKSSIAIAKLPKTSSVVKVEEIPSNIKQLKEIIKKMKGRKIITFEETTPSQWLYVELKEVADEILVCDPSRNHLLSEGAKNDRLDAIKLVKLLRAGLLKPVYHTADELTELRKLVSGYEDIVKAGVRLKNQEKSYYRRIGNREITDKQSDVDTFVLHGLEKGIQIYKEDKEKYEKEFRKQSRKYPEIKILESIPGIGLINAVKILAVVVDPRRFPSRNHFLSYCGLIRLDMMSGGVSYGSKRSRYCRILKNVFKVAALVNIHPHINNVFKQYYLKLIEKDHYPEYKARHALARRIAVYSLGVLKTKRKFNLGGEELECKAESRELTNLAL